MSALRFVFIGNTPLVRRRSLHTGTSVLVSSTIGSSSLYLLLRLEPESHSGQKTRVPGPLTMLWWRIPHGEQAEHTQRGRLGGQGALSTGNPRSPRRSLDIRYPSSRRAVSWGNRKSQRPRR